MRLFGRGDRASTLDLLVVGLGNPGREHAADRHNVGWMVVDELARRHGGSFQSKFSGRLAELRLGESPGRAARARDVHERLRTVARRRQHASSRFRSRTSLVVHDDVDLETGRLQARAGGGLAGHNGLRSIAQALGSQDFLRLRVGVGRPGRGDRRDVADYVLSRFEAEDDRDGIVARASDAVETLVAEGLDEAQRRFN